MADQILQAASLVGHVIEDQSFDAVSRGQFMAELVGTKRAPQYKDGGFFVFSDILAGNYTLRISGEQFQTEELAVVLPSTPPILDAPGDDELAVIIRSLDNVTTTIAFDPVILPKPFRVRSRVVSATFSGTLAATLDAGKVTGAKLNTLAGLSVGDIVRVIRDKSIRMRYGPYSTLPPGLTRVVGKTVLKGPPARELEGVLVRLTAVNGNGVSVNNVAGVNVVTAQVGVKTVVLGTERDAQTLSNQSGDYNLYFGNLNITGLTLEATRAGLQTLAQTIAVTPKARNRADFEMLKV